MHGAEDWLDCAAVGARVRATHHTAVGRCVLELAHACVRDGWRGTRRETGGG